MGKLMTATSEESLLLAVETHETLFGTLDEMLSSENYLKVLFVVEEGKTQSEMADEADVGGATVSRAISELKEFGLVEA